MKEVETQLVALVVGGLRDKLYEHRRKHGSVAKALGADIDQWTLNFLEAMPQAVDILKQKLLEKMAKKG